MSKMRKYRVRGIDRAGKPIIRMSHPILGILTAGARVEFPEAIGDSFLGVLLDADRSGQVRRVRRADTAKIGAGEKPSARVEES